MVTEVPYMVDDWIFDRVVSNPPYQMGDASTSTNSTIYHRFINMGRELSKTSIMVHPGRMLFKVGKIPQTWMADTLADKELEVVYYQPYCHVVFPTAQVKGGIAITKFIHGYTLGGYPNGFVVFDELRKILDKVTYERGRFSEIISPQGYYKFTDKSTVSTHVFRTREDVFIQPDAQEENIDYYTFIGLDATHQRVVRHVKRSFIHESDMIDTYKVFMPKASGSGKFGQVLSEPTVGLPGTGCTETFLNIGPLNNESEAQAVLKYLKTRFLRTLLATLKVTQDNKAHVWANVPLQDFTSMSDINWDLSVAEIDNLLFQKYGLSDSESLWVKHNVAEMI